MFHSEGDKAIRALRMMIRQVAKCDIGHRVTASDGSDGGRLVMDTRACDACVERDYRAALEIAEREVEKEGRRACERTQAIPSKCDICDRIKLVRRFIGETTGEVHWLCDGCGGPPRGEAR